ncbi:MAG TPA: prepilin-type N-terminal cleavage/methylation domain-containing protein [Terriglobia bacterium]|jgi:type IV pilus assembly protein PilA|nr:prepilin-type N-terminal cleavage/methylation domain-containing protein [Terriglobia bacterium]
MKKKDVGFSLIELLIVVAIILIIAAIAIPNLLKSKMAANQSSAVASLRTLNTSEVTYSTTYNLGFTSSLAQLGPPSSGSSTSAAAGLVDSVLAGGTKSGYTFTFAAGSAVNGSTPSYTINANPETPGTTGQNYYFTDESNVIRQNSTQQAAATDSPIGG